MRQLRDTVNSIETKWQLDVAVIVVIVIVVIVIVIVVVLNYAKIDPRIRSAPSQITALCAQRMTPNRSKHSADHRFAMMIMLLPRGQRGAASTPGPGTDCN